MTLTVFIYIFIYNKLTFRKRILFLLAILFACLEIGMGFEYDLLKAAAPGAEGYPEFAMDLAFLHSQLEAMEPYACAKFPGIEINYRKDVVPTSPEYVDCLK